MALEGVIRIPNGNGSEIAHIDLDKLISQNTVGKDHPLFETLGLIKADARNMEIALAQGNVASFNDAKNELLKQLETFAGVNPHNIKIELTDDIKKSIKTTLDTQTGQLLPSLDKDLSGINLDHVNLSGTDLSGVNLTGATLHGADLSGANLSGATLDGATLDGANLSKANLENANLNGAKVTGANVSGANMTGAQVDEKTKMHGLIADNNTKFDVKAPEGSTFDLDGKNGHERATLKVGLGEANGWAKATGRFFARFGGVVGGVIGSGAAAVGGASAEEAIAVAIPGGESALNLAGGRFTEAAILGLEEVPIAGALATEILRPLAGGLGADVEPGMLQSALTPTPIELDYDQAKFFEVFENLPRDAETLARLEQTHPDLAAMGNLAIQIDAKYTAIENGTLGEQGTEELASLEEEYMSIMNSAMGKYGTPTAMNNVVNDITQPKQRSPQLENHAYNGSTPAGPTNG